jgi:hypothetical protein
VATCTAFLPAHDNPMTLEVDEGLGTFRLSSHALTTLSSLS